MTTPIAARALAEIDLPTTAWRGYDRREVDALVARAQRTLAAHEGDDGGHALGIAALRVAAEDPTQSDGVRELVARVAEQAERDHAAFEPLRAADLHGIGFTARLVGSGYERDAVDALLARIHAALVAHERR